MTIEDEIDRLNVSAEEKFSLWLASAGLSPDPKRRMTLEEVRQLPARMPPPLPDDLDAGIERIVTAYAAATDAERDRWRERLNTYGGKRLLRFAADMAVKAVKLNSAECIDLGLAAVAMESGRQDYRDSLFPVATLYHSALKLNLDAAYLFARAAALTLPGYLRNELKSFPLRPERQRSLEAFYLREVGTGDDFRYESGPRPSQM